MYPLLLKPTLKDYIWGGTKLKTEYGKETDLDIVAESWEISIHKDGKSVIANGEHKGKTLDEIAGADFPILVKLIDAKQSLSVQVHPDDEYAKKTRVRTVKQRCGISLKRILMHPLFSVSKRKFQLMNSEKE